MCGERYQHVSTRHTDSALARIMHDEACTLWVHGMGAGSPRIVQWKLNRSPRGIRRGMQSGRPFDVWVSQFLCAAMSVTTLND